MTHDSDARRNAPLEGALRRSGGDPTLSVDDLWLHEWAADGFEQLAVFLAAHAAFDEFLGRWDNGGDDGDGS